MIRSEVQGFAERFPEWARIEYAYGPERLQNSSAGLDSAPQSTIWTGGLDKTKPEHERRAYNEYFNYLGKYDVAVISLQDEELDLSTNDREQQGLVASQAASKLVVTSLSTIIRLSQNRSDVASVDMDAYDKFLELVIAMNLDSIDADFDSGTQEIGKIIETRLAKMNSYILEKNDLNAKNTCIGLFRELTSFALGTAVTYGFSTPGVPSGDVKLWYPEKGIINE